MVENDNSVELNNDPLEETEEFIIVSSDDYIEDTDEDYISVDYEDDNLTKEDMVAVKDDAVKTVSEGISSEKTSGGMPNAIQNMQQNNYVFPGMPAGAVYGQYVPPMAYIPQNVFPTQAQFIQPGLYPPMNVQSQYPYPYPVMGAFPVQPQVMASGRPMIGGQYSDATQLHPQDTVTDNDKVATEPKTRTSEAAIAADVHCKQDESAPDGEPAKHEEVPDSDPNDDKNTITVQPTITESNQAIPANGIPASRNYVPPSRGMRKVRNGKVPKRRKMRDRKIRDAKNNIVKCPACRKEVLFDFQVCPYCGQPFTRKLLEKYNDTLSIGGKEESAEVDPFGEDKPIMAKGQATYSRLSIGAFVCSLLGCVSIVGLVLGIVDLVKAKEDGHREEFSVAAVIIASLILFVGGIGLGRNWEVFFPGDVQEIESSIDDEETEEVDEDSIEDTEDSDWSEDDTLVEEPEEYEDTSVDEDTEELEEETEDELSDEELDDEELDDEELDDEELDDEELDDEELDDEELDDEEIDDGTLDDEDDEEVDSKTDTITVNVDAGNSSTDNGNNT